MANRVAFPNLSFLICKMGIVPTSLKSALRMRNATRLSNCRKEKQSLRLKLDTLHAKERPSLPASSFSAYLPHPQPVQARGAARVSGRCSRERLVQKPISLEHTQVLLGLGQWFPFNKYFPQGHFTSGRQLFKGNRRAGWLRGLFRPLYPKNAHLTQETSLAFSLGGKRRPGTNRPWVRIQLEPPL